MPGHQQHNFICELFANNHSFVVKQINNIKPASLSHVEHGTYKQAQTYLMYTR